MGAPPLKFSATMVKASGSARKDFLGESSKDGGDIKKLDVHGLQLLIWNGDIGPLSDQILCI